MSPGNIEAVLKQSKETALTNGTVIYKGGEYGAVEETVREIGGERGLSAHLDYDGCKENGWVKFLNTGSFMEAESELNASHSIVENPWAYHGLASLYILTDKKEQARRNMIAGLKMRTGDLT